MSPERAETAAIDEAHGVVAMVRRLGLPPQLLAARVAWERLHGELHPPGAPAPSVALAVLTRDSRRRWALARARRRQSLPAALSSRR